MRIHPSSSNSRKEAWGLESSDDVSSQGSLLGSGSTCTPMSAGSVLFDQANSVETAVHSPLAHYGSDLGPSASLPGFISEELSPTSSPPPLPLSAPPRALREKVGPPIQPDPVNTLNPRVHPETGVLLPYAWQPQADVQASIPKPILPEEQLRPSTNLILTAESVLGKEEVETLIRDSQEDSRNAYQELVSRFPNPRGEWRNQLKFALRKEMTSELIAILQSASSVDNPPHDIQKYMSRCRERLAAKKTLLVAEYRMAFGQRQLNLLRQQEAARAQQSMRFTQGTAMALKAAVSIAGAAMLLIAPEIGFEALALGSCIEIDSFDSDPFGEALDLTASFADLFLDLGEASKAASEAASFLQTVSPFF